jgi:LPXTG-motif cell wall-anchored protein
MTRRLPVWLAGAALGAGTVIAVPSTSAYACAAENPPAAPGGITARAERADVVRTAAEASPVQVSAHPGSLVLERGSAPRFAVEVTNSGPKFTGRIDIAANSASDGLGLPGISIDRSTGGGWTELPMEGAAGTWWFTGAGLTFRTGQTAFDFRVNVSAKATPGQQLRFGIRVTNAAGKPVAFTSIQGTVTGAKPLLRTTFPDRLRRGGPYREFDVAVRNPTAATFHDVRLVVAFEAAPNDARDRLKAKDIQLEKRVGGAWQRMDVRSEGGGGCGCGCSWGPGSTISGPFDLGPSASRNLHLRIRLTDSTPAALRSGNYAMDMISPDLEEVLSINGRFLIEPRRQSGGSGQPSSPPATKPSTPAATGSHTQPATPGSQHAEAPSELPHTGAAALLPFAGGLLLMLGGFGVLALARRHQLTRPGARATPEPGAEAAGGEDSQ